MSIRLTVFFTFGVSLKDWAESGLLQREVILYKKLQERGVIVKFITYGDETDRQWQNLLDGIELHPVYERMHRPRIKVVSLLSSLIIPWMFRYELKQSDVYKTNQIWGGWVAVLSKWLYRKPVLARGGYDAYRNAVIGNESKIKKIILYCASWLTYRNADHIWLNTDQILNFVINTFHISDAYVTVFPNWIDVDKFSDIDILGEDQNRVLFVGRLSPEKNISLLLGALSGTGIGLDIVGDGSMRNSLQDESKKLQIDVRFLGLTPNDDLPIIYNEHSVYVLCSHYEGNPKTLLEAMSCGCAVIGTDVPGIQEVIKHDSSGVLVKESSDELRCSIQKLMTNKIQRQHLGKNARIQVEKNNSLETMLKLELSVYHKLFAQFMKKY
jgi:glycosyltransferase involved in cell wall biosynthesis